jgi:hypothetical protein
LSLALSAAGLQGATVVISDGTFAPADWTSEVRFDVGLSSAGTTITQVGSGGSPGAYRQTSYTLVHSGLQTYGAIYVLNAFQAQTYTPSAQGAINSLSYAEDRTRLSASWAPSLVGAMPALFQNGKYYVGPNSNFGPADNFWQTYTTTGLLATNFIELSGTIGVMGLHPDFSATGSTITFGYARANSTSFNATLSQGIDDWNVTLDTVAVPEPSRATLLLAGVLSICSRRRRASAS